MRVRFHGDRWESDTDPKETRSGVKYTPAMELDGRGVETGFMIMEHPELAVTDKVRMEGLLEWMR